MAATYRYDHLLRPQHQGAFHLAVVDDGRWLQANVHRLDGTEMATLSGELDGFEVELHDANAYLSGLGGSHLPRRPPARPRPLRLHPVRPAECRIMRHDERSPGSDAMAWYAPVGAHGEGGPMGAGKGGWTANRRGARDPPRLGMAARTRSRASRKPTSCVAVRLPLGRSAPRSGMLSRAPAC